MLAALKSLFLRRIDREGTINARVQRLEERILEMELKGKFSQSPSSMGPPPGMENLRPAYKTRSVRIMEAQKLLNEKQRKDAPDVANK